MRSLKQRVTKGAKFLDKKYPEWWKEINTASLNLGSCLHCVLGQLYGYYGKGTQALNITFRAPDLGFCTDSGFDCIQKHKELTKFWIEEVQKRKDNPQ